jgi:disulfide bond formation protein DsbB
MSKRNLILLIIILVIAIIAFFGFLYFRPGTTPGTGNAGTNFISQFNPFGNGTTTTKPPVVTPPVDVSGNQPNPPTQTNSKLIKVSSMPIAGYTVFSKER